MRTEQKMNKAQGHWVLASLGKRVLRPGGKELTLRMLEHLDIKPEDDVVEFAPGLGFTANITLKSNPHSYTAVEINEEAAQEFRKYVDYPALKQVIADAGDTGIEPNTATKLYGEAMLTMQPNERKKQIMSEAARILKPGGLYGIHEIGLTPDNVSEEVKKNLQRDMADAIQVTVRPLTRQEWSGLLEECGFEVIAVETNPMHLLEKKRMIQDEGFGRFLRIVFRLLTRPATRKRVKAMRATFRKHGDNMNAISLVARKK